eukprot:GHVT01105034.1.p1 GENE.GHVT01105034.1~~GHVT01105034.1.p1  ORF type:complete len:381 (-),score=37.91 GHVT01105034.1:220-1362(-)
MLFIKSITISCVFLFYYQTKFNTLEEVETMVIKIEDGMSNEDLAEYYQCSKATIIRTYKKYKNGELTFEKRKRKGGNKGEHGPQHRRKTTDDEIVQKFIEDRRVLTSELVDFFQRKILESFSTFQNRRVKKKEADEIEQEETNDLTVARERADADGALCGAARSQTSEGAQLRCALPGDSGVGRPVGVDPLGTLDPTIVANLPAVDTNASPAIDQLAPHVPAVDTDASPAMDQLPPVSQQKQSGQLDAQAAPPTAADLERLLEQAIATNAVFGSALFAREDPTSWDYQAAITLLGTEAKGIPPRKLRIAALTCFRYGYEKAAIPVEWTTLSELSTMWVVWDVMSRAEFLAVLRGFMKTPTATYWTGFWATLPGTIQASAT